MEKWFFENIVLFKKRIVFLSLFFPFCFALFSCASSNVSRDVSSNISQGMQHTGSLASNSYDMSGAYEDLSQATKGAMIGGAVGMMASTFSPGLGFIPATATGAVLGASYGLYIDANSTLQDQLENRGANIVVLGDQILIVLSSASLFKTMTPTVTSGTYSTLALVARYINQYHNMLVKVTAYTARSGSSRADLELSKQQAEQVAKILLASGLNARVLYAEGAGGAHLVTDNSKEWAESDNYRIEITVEKLYSGIA